MIYKIKHKTSGAYWDNVTSNWVETQKEASEYSDKEYAHDDILFEDLKGAKIVKIVPKNEEYLHKIQIPCKVNGVDENLTFCVCATSEWDALEKLEHAMTELLDETSGGF